MRTPIVLSLCLAFAGLSPLAQGAEEMRTLDTVVVSGIRPGPGLWQVSSGGNTLWILGTVSPVPRDMEWYSPQTEAVLREVQEVVERPGIGMTVGFGGAFKAALAMPTLLRARKNADGKTLRDVLPAELYQRWSAARMKYLPKDESVEEWRPVFAVGKLYEAALQQAGLQSGTGTGPRISKLVEARKIKRTSTSITYRLTDPKGMAKSFIKADVDETACFRSMLDRIETDVANAALRANAWAVGDITELERLTRSDRIPSCLEAFSKVEAMQATGLLDADVKTEAKWLAAVDAALAANRSSFATLPVSELFEADGLLARLRARRYGIVAPE